MRHRMVSRRRWILAMAAIANRRTSGLGSESASRSAGNATLAATPIPFSRTQASRTVVSFNYWMAGVWRLVRLFARVWLTVSPTISLHLQQYLWHNAEPDS
jgi:hypothetical protein